jgi:starvation-inducible DNA-binding protein
VILDRDLNQHILNTLKETHHLAMLTKMAHWLTNGKHFPSWHELFEKHYNQLNDIIDETAETLLMFNGHVPYELSFFTSYDGQLPQCPFEQVELLDNRHQICVECLKLGVELAESQSHHVIVDLLVQHQAQHQKILWYYRNITL